MSVRVRIAPSPTGDPHVGTIYIGLFNLAYAKKFNGQMILRIEDTDRARSKIHYEQRIFDALKWSKIKWDEGPDIGGDFGPYRQSERLDIYRKYAQLLLDKKKAYKCFATKEELEEMRQIASKGGQKIGYDRRDRNLSEKEVKEREKVLPYSIRLKVPLSGECVYYDNIKGKISCPWADVDDQILLKSDGFPTYHLANVVDDHLMKITHVIRGDEWLTSMPKHILLYEYFGWEPPTFIHMPLLLGKDGKKLSKRRNPTSIFYFKKCGFLPESMINFLTLMGYSMPDVKEFYSLEEFISQFDPKRIGTSGAFFDIKKLEWINQKYIIDNLSEDQLWENLKAWSFNDSFMKKLMPLVHTRIKTYGDFIQLSDFFFINNLEYTEQLLCPKIKPEEACYILQTIIWSLEKKDEWSAIAIEKTSHEIALKFNINHKKMIMPILFGSLMGKRCGLPLFASAEILGKERTRARLLNAIEFLGGISNKKMNVLKKCWEKNECIGLIKG